MGVKVFMDQQTEKRKLDKEAKSGREQKKAKVNAEGAIGGSASNKEATDSSKPDIGGSVAEAEEQAAIDGISATLVAKQFRSDPKVFKELVACALSTVLASFLNDFTEVKEFGSVAAVCLEWKQALRNDAFWENACALRWPFIAKLPIQNFFQYYRSHVISQQRQRDNLFDEPKYEEWLADTFLMIEAIRDGQLVSLALHFKDAVGTEERLGWQVRELGRDDDNDAGSDDNDEGSQLGNIFLKTCHLWRASDGRMCLLAKNVLMEPEEEGYCTDLNLRPATFWAEPDNSMSFQLHYSISGASEYESKRCEFGLSLHVLYADGMYADPRNASLRKPILTICGNVYPDGFAKDWPCWPNVGMCELFHMTSVLSWK